MEPRWKIAELAEVVGRVMASTGQVEQTSARVRDVPDLRTIRYYTTLGMVDRPLEMQGRTAYYGRRHVWQLLAIKRLQATGATLVEIQQKLAGANDRTLQKLAGAPNALLSGERYIAGPAAPVDGKRTVTRSETFWADATVSSPLSSGELAPAVPTTGLLARPAVHLKLAEGVTLVLEGVQLGALNRDKVAAIEIAARGLVKQLRRQGITTARKGTDHDPSPTTV